MQGQAADPATQVRKTFDDVVAEGFRADMVEGASDDEIDRMADAQGVPAVPAALREVLRLLGKKPGLWFSGTAFGVDGVDADTKRDAVECLDEAESHDMVDPQNMLAVLDGGSYSYLAVDGSDLENPNPPLWMLTESGDVTKRWDSVTSWFANVADGVRERKERLASRRARGKADPAREAYFVWPEHSAGTTT